MGTGCRGSVRADGGACKRNSSFLGRVLLSRGVLVQQRRAVAALLVFIDVLHLVVQLGVTATVQVQFDGAQVREFILAAEIDGVDVMRVIQPVRIVVAIRGAGLGRRQAPCLGLVDGFSQLALFGSAVLGNGLVRICLLYTSPSPRD